MQREAVRRTTVALHRIVLLGRSAHSHAVPRTFVRQFAQNHEKPWLAVSSHDRNQNVRDPAGFRPFPAPPISAEIDLESLLNNVLSRSRSQSRKQHYETENDGLRQSLMQLPKYPATFSSTPGRVSLPAKQLALLREKINCANQLTDVRAVIELLADVSYLASIARGRLMEEPAFEAFAEHVASRLQSSENLTFSDLHSLLQSFHRFRFETLPHIYPPSNILRMAIDAKCIEILPQLSRDEAFVLSDLWYLASCSRLAQFPQHVIATAKNSASQLLPHQCIRLLLAVTHQRKVHPDVMLQVERTLLPHVADLCQAELAVICAGFFKTQTTPGADFAEKLLSRLLLLETQGTSNDVSVALFAKFLNRYALPSMHEPLQRFLLGMKPQISTLGVPALAHLAAIMETTMQLDEDFLFRLGEKLLATMPNVRLKDVAKIAKVFAFFNFRPLLQAEDFFVALQKMAEQTVKVEEIAAFPSKLVELLAVFAQMSIFSKPLLAYMTSQAFWKTYLGQSKSLLVNNELLQLHYAIELEYPEFGKPLISNAVLKSLTHGEEAREAPVNSAVTSLLKGLQTLLQEGDKNSTSQKQSVALFSPLPYAEPLLVVRLKDFSPLPLPEELCSVRKPISLTTPPHDGTCSIVMYHPWWDYTSPMQQLTGLCEMKIRHLRILGYGIIQISQLETQEMTFVRKVKFLRDKLFFEQAHVGVPREYISDKTEKRFTNTP